MRIDRNSSTKALRDACEAAISKALFDCGEELRAEGTKFGTATALLEEVARRVAHGQPVAALLDVAEAAGLQHWPTDCPYLGCKVCKALVALDRLLPQGEPE